MSDLQSRRIPVRYDPLLYGGGRVGSLLRSIDWTETPLGPRDDWPHSLKTAVGICLESLFPMAIWWGPSQIQLYNDAFEVLLGEKHPKSLGQPASECWSEAWAVLGPQCDRVLRTGEATLSRDLLLEIDRHGYLEETYFTFSCSPIHAESGEIGGVLVTCTETTERVLGERRLGLLHDLGALSGKARSASDACRLACEVLGEHPKDVPFAAIYWLESRGSAGPASRRPRGPGQRSSPARSRSERTSSPRSPRRFRRRSAAARSSPSP
jgi:hypothetical protein